MGCYNILGDGKKIRFWHEVVLGDCPLKIRFNNLFQICNQQNWVVAKVLEGLGQVEHQKEFWQYRG
jgi:hypothetical protein